MPITFLEDKKILKIDTSASTCILKIWDEGYLLCLYYGAKIPDANFDGYEFRDWASSFSPRNEVIGETVYSPDTAPLEYSGFGTGDFRKTATRFEAPVVLLFVSDTEKLKPTPDGRDFAAMHVGAAAQDVSLYCASEGLANVWVGGLNTAAVAEALELPAKWKVQLALPVGHPAE